MKLINQVNQFIEAAIPVWENYWQKRLNKAEGDKVFKDALLLYRSMTRYGKHIRAFLIDVGYQMAGQNGSVPDILLASCSIEVLHNAFLIHDDIVDKSLLRRNELTVHQRIAREARNAGYGHEEASHFGVSQALHLGDLAQALAQDFILAAPFSAEGKIEAIDLFNLHVQNTITGQIKDMEQIPLDQLKEETVHYIQTKKTACYSVLLPLMVGYVLGRGDPVNIPSIEKYSLSVGVVFQMQDDVLGLFGSEEEIGKPIDSDIKEAKKTLLFAKGYQTADERDRHHLDFCFGNPEINDQDIEQVQYIIRKTGALEYSQKKAENLTREALQYVSRMKTSNEVKKTLEAIAYFVGNRKY